MECLEPAVVRRLLERQAAVGDPALVHVVGDAVGPRRPDDLRHRVGEAADALLGLRPELRDLALPQPLLVARELLPLLVQLEEDGDLRAEDLRVERLEDVVHGAGLVAAEDVPAVLADRGQEEDRDVPRPLPLLDQLRGLEAVEARHLDVEQDDRELLLEQVPQGLLARHRGDEPVAERLEDRLQREEVVGAVVDEEDRAHETPTAQSSAMCGPMLSSGRTVAGAAASAAAGISRASAVSGSWTIAAPPRFAIRARPAAPSAFAPVRTTPITRSPYASAADSNRTSIDGRACRTRSSTESAKLPGST